MSEKLTLKSLCICSLFCGILCVFSQISFAVPFGVSFTLQTFAIAFLSYLLPLKLSLLTVGGYILLGAVGLPVFSNFSGGVGTLFGNTGGFIFGFFALAFFCSYFKNKSTLILLLLSLLGVVILHILGTSYFAFVWKISFFKSLALVSLPFILKDVLCIIFAYFLARKLRKRINRIF